MVAQKNHYYKAIEDIVYIFTKAHAKKVVN